MSEKNKTENIDLNLEDIIVVFVGKDEIVADINQKGCILLEYQKNEVVGKNWFDVFVPESDREEMQVSFHQLLNGTHRRGHIEKHVLTKSGVERLVGWHILPVKNEEGELAGAILSGLDVTDHKTS